MFLLIVVLFCLFRLMSGSSEVRRAGARLQVFDRGSLPRLPGLMLVDNCSVSLSFSLYSMVG
jgi:hypothetical protein